MKRCTVCYRQARGFCAFASGYHYSDLRRIREAKAFCSMQCMHIFSNQLKNKEGNMIDLTPFEQEAMAHVLKPLGDYVAQIGMEKPLAHYTVKEIQTLVETVITTYQAVMQDEQTYTQNKELPF